MTLLWISIAFIFGMLTGIFLAYRRAPQLKRSPRWRIERTS